MTQKEKVLHHIQRFGSITDMDAFHKYGICRLSARIHELRKDGHNIETQFVTQNNLDGKKVSFGLYKFSQ